MVKTKKKAIHPIAKLSRQRIASMKGTGQWTVLAKRSGLSYRSISALAQGKMIEMTLSREIKLAESLGIRVTWEGAPSGEIG